MARKSKPKVEGSGHLSEQSQLWCVEMVLSYDLNSPQILLVISAAECLDRIREARATIEEQGAYFTDRFGQPKAHPALAVERASRVTFARLVRELGLKHWARRVTRADPLDDPLEEALQGIE